MFTYAHDTWGASQAYGLLTEQIAVMRMLRGTDVHPIVHLEKRPWKSATFGMQMRPHFQPTGDWRTPGGDTGGSVPLPPQSPPPQLGGSSSVTPASTPTTPATPSSTPSAPTAPPPAAAASTQPSSTILDHMKPVKPVTVGEFVADELPWK
jgi:hypothetical protein